MRTILVVDDHPEGRLYLTTLLGYYGYRLQEAGDARDALALMRHSPPDLVITDIVMPTMDGYEFVRQLRSTSDTATIPVIFYSASYLERETRATLDLLIPKIPALKAFVASLPAMPPTPAP